VVKDLNAREEKLLTASWTTLVDNIAVYLKAYYHDWDTMYHYGEGRAIPSSRVTPIAAST
jgi:hypothetical protein